MNHTRDFRIKGRITVETCHLLIVVEEAQYSFSDPQHPVKLTGPLSVSIHDWNLPLWKKEEPLIRFLRILADGGKIVSYTHPIISILLVFIFILDISLRNRNGLKSFCMWQQQQQAAYSSGHGSKGTRRVWKHSLRVVILAVDTQQASFDFWTCSGQNHPHSRWFSELPITYPLRSFSPQDIRSNFLFFIIKNLD